MLRFIIVILMNLFRAPFMIPKMRYEADHPEKYSEKERYELSRLCIKLMNKSGRISTVAYGQENLPKEGGYIMYPNHQGKYDALGIILTHDEPCSLVIDKKKSKGILVREFVDLVRGKRLEIDNVRQGIHIINTVTMEVKNGKKCILFPEGGYFFNNKNVVCDFKAGSFKAAVNAKVPIVPVVLVDSYRVFNSFLSLKPVTTQVHYLKPLYYEDYKDLKTKDIAQIVKEQIDAKMQDVLSGR